jgi:predicted metal-dependent phosphotriesterase family hydrolase
MKVRTVLGDVVPEELGVTDSHDHLFVKSAVLPGRELDDEDAALAEATVRLFVRPRRCRHQGQLLLGGDTTTARARGTTGEGPGMQYLLGALRPRLIRRFGGDIADQVFIANPARAFAWT